MKKIYEAALIMAGTLGWWGFVYPELCLGEDVYRQEAEYCQEDDALPMQGPLGQDHDIVLPGGSSQAFEDGFVVGKIRIKSRIVEYLYQEKDDGEKILKAEKR